MLDPATIGLGVSIGSSLLGIGGGLSGQKKAKKAAKAQAELTYMQRMEEIRRLRQQQDYTLSENKARAYASNIRVTGSSSTASFMNRVRSDFAADVNYRLTAADLERTAIRKGAPGSASAFGTVASGLASIGASIMNYNA